MPYSPLGRGFLTGKIKTPEDLEADDWRRSTPRFQGENLQKNLDLVTQIQRIAKEKGCTPGQLALAWVLARGDDIVPIPEPSAANFSRKISAPPGSRSPLKNWQRSTAFCRQPPASAIPQRECAPSISNRLILPRGVQDFRPE